MTGYATFRHGRAGFTGATSARNLLFRPSLGWRACRPAREPATRQGRLGSATFQGSHFEQAKPTHTPRFRRVELLMRAGGSREGDDDKLIIGDTQQAASRPTLSWSTAPPMSPPTRCPRAEKCRSNSLDYRLGSSPSRQHDFRRICRDGLRGFSSHECRIAALPLMATRSQPALLYDEAARAITRDIFPLTLFLSAREVVIK